LVKTRKLTVKEISAITERVESHEAALESLKGLPDQFERLLAALNPMAEEAGEEEAEAPNNKENESDIIGDLLIRVSDGMFSHVYLIWVMFNSN
jgi:hypothetical protein